MISWTVVFTFFVALGIGLWFGFKLGVASCWAYIQQELLLAKAKKDGGINA